MANPRCFSLASIQFNQNQARDDGGEEKRAYESVYTYTHDNEMHMSRMYPKPERWPQYNDVVHNPEDGPVERVSFWTKVLSVYHLVSIHCSTIAISETT